MNTILTLCETCAGLYGESYRAKKLTTATTELKKACERCKKKGDKYTLARYLIQGRNHDTRRT